MRLQTAPFIVITQTIVDCLISAPPNFVLTLGPIFRWLNDAITLHRKFGIVPMKPNQQKFRDQTDNCQDHQEPEQIPLLEHKIESNARQHQQRQPKTDEQQGNDLTRQDRIHFQFIHSQCLFQIPVPQTIR